MLKTALLKTLFITIILFTNMAAFCQTTTICGGSVPSGWVTIAVSNCSSNGSTLLQRTITNTANLATGATLNICDDLPPTGWVTTSMNTGCQIGVTSYEARTIKKIEGMATGATVNICNDHPPTGWITTSMNTRCTVGVNSYEARTIKKIEGMSTGTTISICSDPAPAGWITTAMNPDCAVGVDHYLARTITKIEGMATGATVNVCNDPAPTSWITISMNADCVVGVYHYVARTIQKVDGMTSGTILNICSDPPPTGWVTTTMKQCIVGVYHYEGRTIQKVDCMPIGTVIQICNDVPPTGWTTTATGTCTNTVDPVYGYTSRTIKKISGAVAQTITSFTPTIAQPTQTITITGSNFTGASGVSIGGTAAQSFTVVNATTITAVVNSQNTSGNIGVTTSCGTVEKAGFIFCSAIVAPSLTISATPSGTVCEKTAITFTAAPNVTNSVSYQWKKNGANVGTNSTTYTDQTLHNGDIIVCVLSTSSVCASATSATSNNISMLMYTTPDLGADTTITTSCGICATNLDAIYHSSTYYASQWVPTNAANAYPGTYRLSVATVSGCKDTVNVWLNGNAASTLLVCNGGQATLQSDISGGSYQWEVNNGYGYTNIANSQNYQGATTASLVLSNIPDSWYGYKFRCKVGSTYSTEFTLKFMTVWNGSLNNNWENEANWSCGQIPKQNTDIYINSGTIIINSNQICRSIKIGPGATVTIKPGYNLTVLY